MGTSDRDKIKQAIGKTLHEAIFELRPVTSWTKWNNEQILICFAILSVWSWDAIIRICGLDDEINVSEDLESWKLIWQETELRREKISLDDLAQFCIDGVDVTAVLIFGFMQIVMQEIRKEVLRRLEPLRVGKQILFWLDHFPNFREEDLLKAIKPPRSIKLKSGKLIARSDPSREIGHKRKKLDQEGLDMLTMLESYNTVKSAITSAPLGTVPLSPLATVYPDVSQVWARVFPRLVEEQIRANLTELLPILNGKMEKTPFAVFNRYRQAFREELSFSALKGEAVEDKDSRQRRKSNLKPVSEIHYDELERERLSPDLERELDVKRAKEKLSIRLEKLLADAYRPTRPKIRKAIELYLQDETLKDSARRAGVDEKTLRHYVIELRLAPAHSVRDKRKP